MRVLPLAHEAKEQLSQAVTRRFVLLTSAIFRATALAWVASKYTARTNEFGDAANVASDAADLASAAAYAAHDPDDPAASVASAAAAAADAAKHLTQALMAEANAMTQVTANSIADVVAANVSANVAATAAFDRAPIWDEVRTDVAAIETLYAHELADLPLWSRGAPGWAKNEWAGLRAALPNGKDWAVWIDWYEDRLRGGSRGEDYELVFASVPQGVWDKGPATANAWIREHLPKRPEATTPADHLSRNRAAS